MSNQREFYDTKFELRITSDKKDDKSNNKSDKKNKEESNGKSKY